MRKFSLFLVTMILLLLVGSAVSAHEGKVHVRISSDAELGSFLVDANGMTLYVFMRDEPGVSNCSGDCVGNWPPLLAESEEDAFDAVPGVAENLGMIERDDGSYQVTYNDMPLYNFASDEEPGDTYGQGRGDVWFVQNVDALRITGNADLGNFVADADGMTLYIFMNDEPGVSNCSGDCAGNWPPLLVDGMDALPPAPDAIANRLGTIEREDGSYQVTIDDMPLYHFAADEAPGDTNGQGRGDVWFVQNVDAVHAGEAGDLGDVLIDSSGMTLYTFMNDEPGVSNCTEGCAANWPPLLVEDEDMPPAAAFGIPNAFGVIERADGTYQATYDDMPLYNFAGDTAPGDANGQGIGEVWYVIQLGADES